MEYTEVIEKRYSCKKYDADKTISEEQLNRILEAGRLAPTAKNLQEQHIYVIQSEAGLAKVDAASPCRYHATTVLVVAYDKNNVYTFPDGKRQTGVEDVTIVATHMMLAATNAGVDSCWINNLQVDELHESLGLPENEEIALMLDLGFAAEDAKPLPNHFKRKALSETVSRM